VAPIVGSLDNSPLGDQVQIRTAGIDMSPLKTRDRRNETIQDLHSGILEINSQEEIIKSEEGRLTKSLSTPIW
jgi:hypothetical protein